MSEEEGSIDKVIAHSNDGSYTTLNFTQSQYERNPTDDDNVRQIINKDGLDLDKV
eukprot:CAMPEP_0194087854 /NCGR_PEP_ID=MMETSP0149-20130528/26774_1 /TAXON_ID=122233 /ORGANISM="Chaetoceros debilis, Strain MM31A-1" /LENGTH=54 /DNA_ID=CAMNT_0038771353 /DNA_START=121 /DNA_END=281 /DNA_ORIENTATION=+